MPLERRSCPRWYIVGFVGSTLAYVGHRLCTLAVVAHGPTLACMDLRWPSLAAIALVVIKMGNKEHTRGSRYVSSPFPIPLSFLPLFSSWRIAVFLAVVVVWC